jgi:Rrf2 family protein
MISATSEYALRAALLMARAYGERPLRADEIADAIGAPRNYLAKTLNALAKAGIASSARGPMGGFQLARSPESISVSDIIDCFDEPRQNAKCLLGKVACDPRKPCAAHMEWTGIMMARREPLTQTTLSQLLMGSDAEVHSINDKEYDHVVAAF